MLCGHVNIRQNAVQKDVVDRVEINKGMYIVENNIIFRIQLIYIMNTTLDRGEASKDDIRAPSTKQNPSESRGPILKFPRYFIQYRSTYKQMASTQTTLTKPSLRLMRRKASSRFFVTFTRRWLTETKAGGSGSPYVYDIAVYSDRLSISKSDIIITHSIGDDESTPGERRSSRNCPGSSSPYSKLDTLGDKTLRLIILGFPGQPLDTN